jgi:hypothetical protein
VQPVSTIAAGLFALIGALQLVRFITSGIAFVITAALAIMLWREARR